VLGRMTASVTAALRTGRAHVVVGRLLREEGRKTFTATSLYDDGRLVGRAEHTWIVVDPATFRPG
jgi:predicted thioesterase